jgi:hypothetical protein
MKKNLITALLAVSAAFAPSVPSCLPSALDIPARASQLARAAASPLFWHLWDEVLTRGLAHLTQTRSDARRVASHTNTAQPGNAQSSRQTVSQSVTVQEWQPESEADAVACFVFHMVLKHALNSGLSAAQQTGASVMSISWHLVRRTIERGIPLTQQRSATMHLT